MKSFGCRCNNRLFFESQSCLACGAICGLCSPMQRGGAFEPTGKSTGGIEPMKCVQCSSECLFCDNRTHFAVCNGMIFSGAATGRCKYCDLNLVVPDTTISDNVERWRLVENAKRRVLRKIEKLELPVVDEARNQHLPLRFEFKVAVDGPVSTGHDNGLITIDLAEADSVHRERVRVQFGETQRTLVGHFRHELGHYYWQLLVEPFHLDEFRALFGDERDPDYVTAQKLYYDRRGTTGWQLNYISEYATMHPWEDFAETFAAYLDMQAIVTTARHYETIRISKSDDALRRMFEDFTDIAIVVNELNRDMGVVDLVPDVYNEAVLKKMSFIDRFIHQAMPKQSIT